MGLLALAGVAVFAQQAAPAGQYPEALLAGLKWRDVGPMRGGRSYAVAGNADQPDTFYMGSVGGGVWKTENAGHSWQPISDEGIPIGSVGAIAVAPSNPNIVYVGTGEPDIRAQHSYGDGMYKSSDAGKTWKHIGLENSEHIGRIAVDQTNPNRLYVAVLGHVYDANPERGLYRSVDGGTTWKKVLASQKTPNDVGAIEVAIDPKNPRVIYASLWGTRRPPWSVYAPSNLPGGGLFKSTDGGDTWKQLAGGLPTDDTVGKIGMAISPSNPNRVWAAVDDTGEAVAPSRTGGGGGAAGAERATPPGGIYLSNDAGATWKKVNSENRLWGRGWYFGEMAADPKNPDRAYVMNTATFMTTDGGKSWVPVKGAPGGDDYHQGWVNPKDGNRIVISSDQGTVISVDGAKSWSTWYNQPTAEIYHVAADNRFPYWLYGAQQDSGGVGVSTWSREGLLNFRNWEPICEAGESNTVIPDPKDGNILYGGGAGRCDQYFNTPAPLGGQLPAADPNDPNRKTWTLPQVFSVADEAMYYANQFVFRTRDRGRTWEKISPDLTRLNPELPKTLDPLTAKDIDEPMTDRFGVVYSIGPSPLQAQTVWVGTDDGLIHVTRDDAKTWQNVTPPAMTAWSKVSQIEAGHFDAETAYASVDRHRLADNKPYIYRTHDGGKTWQNIAAGIPNGAYVNSIKEDTQVKGLLFACTELRVYVSFNDGERWQSLQNNMPATSVRDIVVHGDDLDVATHGRGFWVLDQMTPLRQIAKQGQEIETSNAYLFEPGETFAIRAGGMNGTPMPHEEPQEENPPSGIVAYYWLKTPAGGPLKLELLDGAGAVHACAASDTPVRPVDTETLNVQAIWQQPAQPPAATAGMHRFALGAAAGRGGGFGGRGGGAPPVQDACTASPADRAAAGGGRGRGRGRGGRGGGRGGNAGLQPGAYTVRLTVDGKTYTQPVAVKADPRGAPKGEEGGGNQ
ncbi:MAG TPA: glycoside hydrolase [Bryobacteraceae bacterium]|nr:glycoside hydrolase [Bryobacteraceae bacterium]